MFFQAYPFIRFLFCLLVGRIIGPYIGSYIYFYSLLLICFLLLLLFYARPNILGYVRRYWVGVIINLLFIVSGIITCPSTNRDGISVDESLVFSAVVKEVLKNSHGKQSVLFSCITSDSLSTQSFNAVAYCKNSDLDELLLPGDKLVVNTKLNTYKETGNPYSFEYSKYMASNGVFYSFYINKQNHIRIGSELNFRRIFYILRKHAEDRLKVLNLLPSEYAVISALLLGNKDHLGYNQKQAFLDSGSMHILAVSGLHLGVVFMLVTIVLGKITRSKLGLLKVIIAMLVLWLYASVSGLSPSIVRACIMLTIFLISKLVSNKYNVYHTLAIAAFLILVGNPYALFNVGFWLSFLAVGSIIYFFPLINKFIYFRKPWSKFIWDIVSVSLAAQVGTVLLSVFTFKFFPLWFLLSNLLMIPILPVILLSALLIVLTPIDGLIANVLGGVLKEGLWYINEITTYISSLPEARFSAIQLSFYEMLGLYAFLLSLVLWRNSKRPLYLQAGLLMLIIVLGFNIMNYINVCNRNLLVVANVNGSSLIIQTEYKSGLVTSNDTLNDYTIKQVVTPIQFEEGLDNLYYSISEAELLTPYITKEENLLRVNGSCDDIAKAIDKYSVDAVIITNNTPIGTIEQIVNVQGVLLIFDSSWTTRALSKFKKKRTENMYFVIEDGAYVLVNHI